MEINPFAFFPVVLDGGKYIYSPADCTVSIIPDWVRVCAGTGFGRRRERKNVHPRWKSKYSSSSPTYSQSFHCLRCSLLVPASLLGRVSLLIQWASDEG